MNKSDIVRLVARDTGLTIKDSEAAVNSFLDITGSLLATGEEVKLSGFGKFYFKTLAAHTMYSFKEQSVVSLQPRKRLRFKLSEKVLDRMKDNGVR